MHFGPKRYVDPEPFANSLLLDHAIQQVGAIGTAHRRLYLVVQHEVGSLSITALVDGLHNCVLVACLQKQ
jgi:hypothetical protein